MTPEWMIVIVVSIITGSILLVKLLTELREYARDYVARRDYNHYRERSFELQQQNERLIDELQKLRTELALKSPFNVVSRR